MDKQGENMKMEKREIGFFSAIFGLLGACAAAAGIWLALNNMNASPVLVEQPEAARIRVVSMLDALCEGDYATVSGSLYGNPSLGLDRAAQDEVGQLFWDALADSYSYTLGEEFHATDSGVALDVVITALDIDSVTLNLRDRAQTLLEERVEEAEDTSEIYDENYDYREEFVMEVLYDAAQDALEQDARTITWEITLNLTYENGQWWIMPENALLEAVSGGILS